MESSRPAFRGEDVEASEEDAEDCSSASNFADACVSFKMEWYWLKSCRHRFSGSAVKRGSSLICIVHTNLSLQSQLQGGLIYCSNSHDCHCFNGLGKSTIKDL